MNRVNCPKNMNKKNKRCKRNDHLGWKLWKNLLKLEPPKIILIVNHFIIRLDSIFYWITNSSA